MMAADSLHHIRLAAFLFFCVSIAISFLVLKFGKRIFPIDVPNERSSHCQPTLKGGGIAILLSFVLANSLYGGDIWSTIIAGAVGIFGLMEDYFKFSPRFRLLVQFSLACAGVFAFKEIPVTLSSSALFIFWVVFIVATMNFYNFMDGINGMSALTGIITFGAAGTFIILVGGNAKDMLVSVAIASACLGFIPFNFPKARMFMGDAGSLFLGYVFAVFTMKYSRSPAALICMAMLLSGFYMDTIITIIHRLYKRERIMNAHREHLYQFMSNELNMPHWKVTSIYALVQFIMAVLAIALYNRSMAQQIIFTIIYSFTFIIFYIFAKGFRPNQQKVW